MRKFLSEYFYFNRTEKNGILLLSGLLLLFFTLPQFFDFFITKNKTDFSAFKAELASLQIVPATQAKVQASAYEKVNAAESTAPLFSFDPNTATKEDFLKLGLKAKLSQTILNFRAKGGHFYKKEDLKKIYGLQEATYNRISNYITIQTINKNSNSEPNEATPTDLFSFDPNTVSERDLKRLGFNDRSISNMLKFRLKGGTFRRNDDLAKVYGLSNSQFEQLRPYIHIQKTGDLIAEKPMPSGKNQSTFKKASSLAMVVKEKIPIQIDVNKANADEWQRLYGIGPAFSKRIINFREKLGGFSSIQQVSETYGLADSTFQSIKTQLIHSPILRKININTCTVDLLKTHPYLDWKQAKVLVNYRNQHGNYTDSNDLKKVKILEASLIEKLSPYLEF